MTGRLAASLPGPLRKGRPVERGFFARPAPTVARALVGMLLVRVDPEADGGALVARVVETEAYTQHDPACHAYRRRTARNAPLYGPPGHAYVYRSYGVHWMLNTSTGVDGVAAGVLVRAAQPLSGVTTMAARRPAARAGSSRAHRELLSGPGRLAQAFGITGRMSGADLCPADAGTPGAVSYLDDGCRPHVTAGPRVGVSQAADWPWRFVATGSPYASRYARSPRAPLRGQSQPQVARPEPAQPDG